MMFYIKVCTGSIYTNGAVGSMFLVESDAKPLVWQRHILTKILNFTFLFCVHLSCCSDAINQMQISGGENSSFLIQVLLYHRQQQQQKAT